MYTAPAFPVLWMLHGLQLHSLAETCQTTSPSLHSFFYWFAWLAITLHGMYLLFLLLSLAGVPFLLLLLRRTALQPFLIWLSEHGLLQTPAAASANTIESMELIEYSSDMFADPGNPSDARPQGECSTCLQEYIGRQ